MARTQKTFGELAERYAGALFDLALEGKALDSAVKDAGALVKALETSPELSAALANPVIDADAKAGVLKALAAKGGFSKPVENFLGVLGANRRADQLESILGAFLARVARHNGVVSASVTSAQPLTDEQRTRVQAAISAKIGKTVEIEEAVDESLLGGLIIQVGSTMFDNSLKSKLGGMVAAMKGA